MNISNSSPLLFLGAPGLIGTHVIPALVKADFSVLAGSRRGLSVGGAPGVAVDMRDPANLARAMQGMATVGLVIPDVKDMESLGLKAVAAAKSAGAPAPLVLELWRQTGESGSFLSPSPRDR